MSERTHLKIRQLYQKRWDRHYIAAKLKTDPLYPAVHQELKETDLPLLDLGCGLGLLAFFLREQGVNTPVHGLDYDLRKIRCATRAASLRNDDGLTFSHHDARTGLPEHLGHVTILDILQFFTIEEQATLLQQAAARVPAGGKLVIRSAIRDDSRRFKITVLGDWLAKGTFWMKAAPIYYPTAAQFQETLYAFGEVTIRPLWGGTPFNNYLIVLRR